MRSSHVKLLGLFLITSLCDMSQCSLSSINHLLQLSLHRLAPPPVSYTLHDYVDMVSEIKELGRLYPDILLVTSGQDLYRSRFPPNTVDHPQFMCSLGQKCETLIVRLASKRHLQNTSLPEVFLSGCLHGDERLGPNVLLEFLRIMCHMYGRHPIITYLVDTRAIWLTPITNAWGYAHNRREELQEDPNRDFPYLPTAKRCMKTITARILNELFRDHLFQLAVTFHSGTRIIGYEWGSFDHIQFTAGAVRSDFNYDDNALQSFPSTESPDHSSQEAIAELLQKAAGQLGPEHPFGRREDYNYRRQLGHDSGALAQSWFYPIGSMNDLVYPVNGGFEDWSYAGSWVGGPPISSCDTPNYPERHTDYTGVEGLRCSTFLIETGYQKNPPKMYLGNWTQIMHQNMDDGELSRNIRVTLKLIELVTPDLIVTEPLVAAWDLHHGALRITGQVLPVGCRHISSLNLVLTEAESCADFANQASSPIARSIPVTTEPQPCRGIGLWEDWDTASFLEDVDRVSWPRSLLPDDKSFIRINVTEAMVGPARSVSYCAHFEAIFDQEWRSQAHPDPAVPPQSHIARSRLEETYAATASAASIDTTRVKRFITGGSQTTYHTATSFFIERSNMLPLLRDNVPLASVPLTWECHQMIRPVMDPSNSCPCSVSRNGGKPPAGVLASDEFTFTELVLHFTSSRPTFDCPCALLVHRVVIKPETKTQQTLIDSAHNRAETLTSVQAVFNIWSPSNSQFFNSSKAAIKADDTYSPIGHSNVEETAIVWLFKGMTNLTSPKTTQPLLVNNVISRPLSIFNDMLRTTLGYNETGMSLIESDSLSLRCFSTPLAALPPELHSSTGLLLKLHPRKNLDSVSLASYTDLDVTLQMTHLPPSDIQLLFHRVDTGNSYDVQFPASVSNTSARFSEVPYLNIIKDWVTFVSDNNLSSRSFDKEYRCSFPITSSKPFGFLKQRMPEYPQHPLGYLRLLPLNPPATRQSNANERTAQNTSNKAESELLVVGRLCGRTALVGTVLQPVSQSISAQRGSFLWSLSSFPLIYPAVQFTVASDSVSMHSFSMDPRLSAETLTPKDYLMSFSKLVVAQEVQPRPTSETRLPDVLTLTAIDRGITLPLSQCLLTVENVHEALIDTLYTDSSVSLVDSRDPFCTGNLLAQPETENASSSPIAIAAVGGIIVIYILVLALRARGFRFFLGTRQKIAYSTVTPVVLVASG